MKIIIFDIGNVLFDFNPMRMTSLLVGDEQSAIQIAEVIFSRHYWARLDLDDIAIADVKNDIKDKLSEELLPYAYDLLDNWVKYLSPIYGIEELLIDLKQKGYKLYFISNLTKEFANTYPQYEHVKNIMDYFDGGVLSGSIHLVKPDKRIYEYLLNKYLIDPDEAIYIDDNIDNIKAGREIGLESYLFDGSVIHLKEYLKKKTI